MKTRLRIGVIDILGKEPPSSAYSRFMRLNNVSIMAQVTCVWCEQAGHDVSIAYYSGPDLLAGGLPDEIDILFVSAFSQAALLAYAFSHHFRHRGVVTVLGGPHARSYPEDALKHFDYVVGFCDESTLREIVGECQTQRPLGRLVSAAKQPDVLPGLRERWKYLQPAMAGARLLRAIPLIGSLGCPYTCSFCIDADVPYQPLDYEALKDDMAFLRSLRMPRTVGFWHDPNFGIRFDDYMNVIEEVVPAGSVNFVCETSLALLNEDRCRRLSRNGFKAVAPGIESWYEMGGKSKTGRRNGLEKVEQVAAQLNLIHRHIPYVQANIIFGLDSDEGPEPFELTKRFVDKAPGIFPHFAVLSAFGRNAQLNLQYQREGRVLPVPFHFLDLVQAMNVKPLHYNWLEFYDHVCDTFDYTFSMGAMVRRLGKNKHPIIRIEQFFRGISSERGNRLHHQRKMRRWLDEPGFRAFFEGETREIPKRWADTVRQHLGPLWKWLPRGALSYEPNAYLHSEMQQQIPVVAA